MDSNTQRNRTTNNQKIFYSDTPCNAILNITSLGFFKAYINGIRVSDDYFVPVLTDF